MATKTSLSGPAPIALALLAALAFAGVVAVNGLANALPLNGVSTGVLSGWIFAWHWRIFWLAMALMLVILATLILLEDGNQAKLAAGGPLAADRDVKPLRRFFLTAPLRVYLGWISVATIANATALLVKSGWNGFGLDPRIWTVAVIGAGLLVALDFSLGKRQIAAPLVIVWAYLGIVIKRTQVDPAYSAPVWIAAALAIAAILAAIIVPRLKRRQT